MKPAGPAVAALIDTARSDKEIADELGISRTTVNRTRRRLATTPQQVMERLAVEAVPIRPAPPVRREWTPDEQAAHRAELLAALAA
jgi:ParB-like chromosome segregation protein Spo0J